MRNELANGILKICNGHSKARGALREAFAAAKVKAEEAGLKPPTPSVPIINLTEERVSDKL